MEPPVVKRPKFSLEEGAPKKEKPRDAPREKKFEVKQTVLIEEEKEIEVKVSNVFTGNTFADLPISDKLKQILKEGNFDKLTSIQKKGIPVIMDNQNVVLKSETGSGKTLAYLVPLIEQLSKYSLDTEKISRDKGTYAIIFSPTRELCCQIERELAKLQKLFYYIVSTSIMGGEKPKKEKERLRKGCTVVIATPGRFLYHLQNTEHIALDRLQTIIIDEADRMLDMGFEREMESCLQQIKKRVP